MKVLEKGEFYSDELGDHTEREIIDSELRYVITDRSGRVGIVTCDCYNVFIEWIDDDDTRYRVVYDD